MAGLIPFSPHVNGGSTRYVNRRDYMSELLPDLRYAFRTFLARPVWMFVIVLTLAIGNRRRNFHIQYCRRRSSEAVAVSSA
jgi:hypothetical protein